MNARLERWTESPRALKTGTLVAIAAIVVFVVGLIVTILLLLIRLSILETRAEAAEKELNNINRIDRSLTAVSCTTDSKSTTTFTFMLTDGTKVIATCTG